MKRAITWMTLAVLPLVGCGAPTATGTDNDAGSANGPGDSSTADGAAAYDSVFTAVEGLDPAARAAELSRQARAEGGTLRWYTAMQQELAERLANAFTDAYGIDVELYRADRNAVLQRVMEESSAGYQSGADVVEAPGVEMVQMSGEGLFVPYKSPIRDDLIEEARFDDWTAERLNVRIPTWNTDLLSEEDRPTSLQDLANPAYRGRLAIGSHDVDWFQTVWNYLREEGGLSEQEVEETFRRMATRSLVIESHSGRANLLAAGEYAVTACLYTHVSDSLIEEGAPISYEPIIEPAILDPNGMALMSSARHPATALLFIDWVMTEGQKVIAESGTTPTRADLFEKSSISEAQTVLVDVRQFAAEQDEWMTRWEQLLRLGEVVESGN